MFGLTGWVNNVVSGAASVVTGGISSTVDNAVQKISEGKPLDALAGVITGGPVGVVTGGAQAIGGIIEGVTGDKTASQAVSGVQAQLNTFTGAASFAVAAVGVGAVAGGKIDPGKLASLGGTQKPSGATAAATDDGARRRAIMDAEDAAMRKGNTTAPAQPVKTKRGRKALMVAGGVAVLGAAFALLS